MVVICEYRHFLYIYWHDKKFFKWGNLKNFSPDFDEEEGKALFEFAEKMQFEFEYRPYKDYTTGNVVMEKLLRIRKLKK